MSKRERSLASLLPYGHFEGNNLVYLRGKGLLAGYNLTGLSVESNNDAQIAAASTRLARSIATWGTGDMLHVVNYRLPASDYPRHSYPSAAATMLDEERRQRFYTGDYFTTRTRLYVTRRMESPLHAGIKGAIFSTASGGSSLTLQRVHLEESLTSFVEAAGLPLERLDQTDIFRDLILSVTGRDLPAHPPAGRLRLNELVSAERVYGGLQPAVGELHIRPICITGYPTETQPQMLATLLRHHGQMTISARFITQDIHDTRDHLSAESGHWHRMRLGSIIDMACTAFGIERRQTLNQHASDQIADIDDALAASAGGMPFGWATITAIVLDANPDRATLRARDLLKDLLAQGIMARLEDANSVEAVLGSLPGDGYHNVRRPMISAENFAELVLPVEHWAGHPEESPLVCTGTGREPFYPPTHIGGVANQLMLGPTGSGKSAALGAWVAALTGIPDVKVVWLDLDYSSFVLSHALGADYHDTDGLSPLGFEQNWLYDWFVRLYARWGLALDERQSADLSRALALASEQGLTTMSELCALLQEPRLRAITAHYTASGQWGHIFDGNVNQNGSAVTVYEMRGLMGLGERVAAPATELILHGAEAAMGTHPTFIIVDEAWRLLSDDISADWLYNSIRTFRKRNSGICLATQSTVEIASHAYRDLLLECCPAKIYLPNGEANGQYVREAYRKLGLHDHEIDLIATAQPRRHYYFHSPEGRRLYDLDLGPLARKLCASTSSRDVARARTLLDNGDFTTHWLGENNGN